MASYEFSDLKPALKKVILTRLLILNLLLLLLLLGLMVSLKSFTLELKSNVEVSGTIA